MNTKKYIDLIKKNLIYLFSSLNILFSTMLNDFIFSIESSNTRPKIKPNLSYAALIAEAILNSRERKLTLRDIYSAISFKYPYYDMGNSGWQNSIRHNLSLNKAFYKLPRDKNNRMSKGSFWTIEIKDAEFILNKQKRTVFTQFSNIDVRDGEFKI